MRGSSLKALILSVAALNLAVPIATQAAISVGPTGSAVLTFDTAPTAGDFNTLTVAGAAGDGYDPDVDIQTHPASTIVTALGTSATVPPSANALARWNSALMLLQTPPTGVRYSILMATLVNDSGADHSTLVINYTLGANDAAGTTRQEEIPGHAAYYSLDGTTWTRITALNSSPYPDDVGPKSAEVALISPWIAGSTMFVAWIDDNGSADRSNGGTEEGGYTIDNLQFLFNVMMPDITVHPAPTTTVDERGTLNLTVTQSGGTTIKWFKGATQLANGTSCVDGHDRTISGATTAALRISGVAPGDAGTYHCEVSNTAGTKISDNASVTVTADSTAPKVLYALCGSNPNEFVIVFSEQLNDACGTIGGGGAVTDISNWTVEDVGAGQLGVVNFTNTASLQNGQTSIGLVTSGSHDPTKQVKISWLADFTDAAATPNTLAAGSTISLCYTQELVAFASTWQYNDMDVDPGATWKDVSFVDNASPWRTGTAPFDAKRDAGMLHPNGLDDCRAMALHNLGPVGTCINLQSPVTLTNLITAYFRTHFTFVGNPSTAVLVLEGKADDGMAVYLNGTEVWRIGLNAGANHTAFSSRTVGDGDAQDVLILGSSPALVSGDNVLAIEVHQVNLTSSDLTMGMKVSQLATDPPVAMKITYDAIGATATITWPGGGTLRSSTSVNAAKPWAAVTGAASPYSFSPTGPQKFFYVEIP